MFTSAKRSTCRTIPDAVRKEGEEEEDRVLSLDRMLDACTFRDPRMRRCRRYAQRPLSAGRRRFFNPKPGRGLSRG